jgi:tetratricopeptide (TPR) repeat protein
MALDREKTFANAERLLKQGKTSLALDECRRLAEDAPKDLLMLNRLGDFLARSQRGADAIVYYGMIAEQFTASGFYPKAIAILKKIVKVDPGHLVSVVRLGELNLKQKLPGEARTWFLQAAEEYLRRREFVKAREVYEKLVAAEPDNVVHVVRLAEARAAEGDPGRAGLELVVLGGRMLAAGRAEDAERTFKRASELTPGRAEPIVGLARCHAAAGRVDEAARMADQAWGMGEHGDGVAGDLLLLFEQMGDVARSKQMLADPRSDTISDEAIEQAFRAAVAAGDAEPLWARVLPLLDRWARARRFDRGAALLERIARNEDAVHLRALEQLVELRKAEGNRATAARAVERLIRAYQSKGLTAKAASQLETLRLFDPTSPLLFLGRTSGDTTSPVASAPIPAAPTPTPTPHRESQPVSALEVPAVPLTPADTEFVSGNLTEAEVFEKYGLHREALQQLRQITSRFPGHVVAQEKLVGFLRTQTDRGALHDGLVALALARRASGDVEGARRAVQESATLGTFESSIQAALAGFGLLPEPVRPAGAAATAPPKATPASAPPPSRVKPPAAPAPVVSQQEDEELELVFDGEEGSTEAIGAGSSEILEEIEFYLGQGMEQDALNRIVEARAAGVDGAALDALEARARAAAPADAADAADAPDAVTFEETIDVGDLGDGGDRLDEEDLSSITAALEAEYGTDRLPEEAASPAEPESEQSVDQVFESFKEHVKASVEVGDFQTHYDLGIAYKEMGLSDAALDEFRIAAGAPELYRDACSMLGLCHWDRGETEEALRWYRAALDAPGGEEVRLSGLRYDLADKLERTGDVQGAYELLVEVLREEPGYRDVDARVATLRSKLGL